MDKNGEEAAMSAGGNPVSNLLSSLFMGILTLAQELKADDQENLSSSNEDRGNKETKEAASGRRDRESIDATRLAQTASLNYDSELPEKQQENTIRRT